MALVLKTRELKGSVSSNLTASAKEFAQKSLTANTNSDTIHVLND